MSQPIARHSPEEPQQEATTTAAVVNDLIETASDAIVVWDVAHGTIVSWNKGAETLYGWTADEAKTTSMQALLHTQFPLPFEDLVAELTAKGSWTGELVHTTRDGRQVVVASRWTAGRTAKGKSNAFLEINTDITERKRAEDALRRMEARFRHLLESAPDGILTIGDDGRIQLVNSQAERMFGYNRAELLHQFVEMLLPEELRPLHESQRGAFSANPRTRPMGIGLELFARKKDGTTLPVEISLSPLTFEGEHMVTAVIRDVSERTAIEAERHRADMAEQALVKRDEFLSVAAHELKTPLTSLRGFTQRLLRQYQKSADLNTEQSARAVAVIGRQSEKLQVLVNQLLDVSRIEAGGLTLVRELCDLVPLVTAVADEAQTRTNDHTVVVHAPQTLTAFVDSLRIEQVLTNLFDNAIKFSPDGGQITIELSQAGGETTLLVRDEGLGIPEEARAHIFDRYYQAHKGSHRPGMGLGLYISRQTVELHGGRIAATFPTAGGTEIGISFPSGAA
jgi:two-component system sensor kinase FixL